jgi:hypothetical protein
MSGSSNSAHERELRERMRTALRSPHADASELLANIPLFSTLDERELAALAARVDEARERAKTVLFHAGDPGDTL